MSRQRFIASWQFGGWRDHHPDRIGGFGIVGGSMRYRRRKPQVTFATA